MNTTFKLLNVSFHNISVKEALQVISRLIDNNLKSNVFFLNADCLRQAQKDFQYREILNNADLVLSDGIGLKIVTWIYGGKMVDNCNGTDLSPQIIELSAHQGKSIFFLGGKERVAQQASANAEKLFSDVKIAGYHSGYFSDDNAVINKINQSGADILFVALGVPKQEKWIASHRDQLNPTVCLGVGAFLDYLAGEIPRAPSWMRKFYLEWCWRILVDPKRMVKRYLIDGVIFMLYVLLKRLQR